MMSEKLNLKDFIEKHYRLIATIGVFGAMTALFVRFESVWYLPFISLMIFFLLMWELLDFFPDIEIPSKSSIKLILFEFLMIGLLLSVGHFIVETYFVVYYRILILVFLFGLYSVIFVITFGKLDLFRRIRSRVKGERYRLIRSVIMAIVVALILILVDRSANSIIDFIETYTVSY